MKFKDEDDLMRKMMKAGSGGGGADIDAELEALGAEISGGKKKKEPKEVVPKGTDLYPKNTEKMYHNIERMTSAGVLEKEKEICDKIIAYKKKINADYDDLEIKKENIDARINSIISFINGGLWDLKRYKQEILNQYKWEVKILQFLEMDPKLNEQQKKIVKDRVEARKKIIDEELKENPEGGKEESKKVEPKKELAKKEPPKVGEVQKGGPDLYPENAEKMYHKVDKMVSIGVLEKEKELYDKIIVYKKKIGADYEEWKMKKNDIDNKIGIVVSFINDGLWDLNRYKKEISKQYKLEVKLLQFVEQDKHLNDQQKKVLKDRIEVRKKIIEEELKEEVDEEEKPEPEEKKKEEPKKETKKKEESKK